MAVEIALLAPWDSRGWKAKIRDRERVEPPHVTILYKTAAWRVCLRTIEFLDRIPDPKEVPDEVLRDIQAKLPELRAAWDRMYAENPVFSRPPRNAKLKRTRPHK